MKDFHPEPMLDAEVFAGSDRVTFADVMAPAYLQFDARLRRDL